MKRLIFVLCGLAAVCTGAEWDSFQVTYGKNGEGYYQMPWSVKEATSERKWIKIDEDKQLNVDIYSQPEDPRVMLLFDKKENIAGIRAAYIKEDVAAKAKTGGYKFEFQYDNNPMYEKGNYFGKDLWHATVLFASPSTLASGGRKVLNKETDEVAEGLYFKNDGSWEELSRDECQSDKDFIETGCFPGMGKHYFYKLNEEDCSTRKSLFSLYDQGRLIGVGIGGYGSFSKHPKTRSYFEEFAVAAAKSIMPNGPKCVQEYINKFGLTTIHIFLKKNASQITCPASDWRSEKCH